jgi:Peptidase propeptide and YPEB domain
MVAGAKILQVQGHPGRGVPARPAQRWQAQMKGKTMKLKLLPALVLTMTPFAALAMPAVGDLIGTEPEAAKVALEKAGCPVAEFEAEDGMIEAKCKDVATGEAMEVYIDPASGKVTDIKAED